MLPSPAAPIPEQRIRRKLARLSRGRHEALDLIRDGIRQNRELIAANPDDAFRIDQWQHNIRALKRHYRNALADLVRGPRPELPSACVSIASPRSEPAMPLRTALYDAAWPEDHDAVRFHVLTRPDARGRQDFYALFWRNGTQQALAYFGRSLAQQLGAAQRKGVVADVAERFGDVREAA